MTLGLFFQAGVCQEVAKTKIQVDHNEETLGYANRYSLHFVPVLVRTVPRMVWKIDDDRWGDFLGSYHIRVDSSL